MRHAAAVLIALLGCPAFADWPMLAHDPGRSGATADEIRPPFERKWYREFLDEGINAGVQPVVAGKRLVIGTLRGVVHCIDTDSGKDVWTHKAGGPVLHAAAIDGDLVFVGAGRKMLALRLADGTVAWTHETPVTIWNAPVVAASSILIGGRDGKLRCFDRAGKLRWSADTPAPLLNSPAVDLKTGRVAVGCEDMRVYAFALADGRPLWTSEHLPGVSFRGYHPVIVPDGSVMITVTPYAGGDAMQGLLLDMVKEVFGEFDSWRIKEPERKKKIREENFALLQKPETYQQEMAYIRKRLTESPALQTFFVLDGATGRQKFVAPIAYAESMNGPAAPPIVTSSGKVIVKYSALLRSRYGHYSPFLNVGYLDTATGQITPIMDESYTYGWHDSLLLVHDEQSQLMVSGNVLVNTHQDNVNAMDLVTLKGYGQPFAQGVHEIQPGTANALWAIQLSGKPLPVGWEWMPRGTGVYGGGSAIDTSIVVDGDSFYFLPSHEISSGDFLIAYRMSKTGDSATKRPVPQDKPMPEQRQQMLSQKWDWDMLATPRLKDAFGSGASVPAGLLPAATDGPAGTLAPPGTKQNPRTAEVREAVAKITDAQIDACIFANLQMEPNPDAAKFRVTLEASVLELISQNWQSLIFPAAKAPSEAYRLMADPIDTLYTLALAYPSLSPDLQREVKAFVLVKILANEPLAQRKFDPANGASRTPWAPAPDSLIRVSDEILRPAAGRVYPIWLWCVVTADNAHLQRHWPALREAALAPADKTEPDLGNARISGLIAACRIARQTDDKPALDKLTAATRSAIRSRLEYEFAHTAGGLCIDVRGQRTILGRWHFLTPEVAHILRTFCADIHRSLMADYIDHQRPAWYVAWNTELLWRNEAPFSFPGMSLDIFAARAMLLREPSATLAGYLDVPWCKADESYVQKLAMLMLSAGMER